MPPLQLLAQAKVGDDRSEPPLPVGARDQDVAGLQVTMSCPEKVLSTSPDDTQPPFQGEGEAMALAGGGSHLC